MNALNDAKISLNLARKRAAGRTREDPGVTVWLMDMEHQRTLSYVDPEKARLKLYDGYYLLAVYRHGEDIIHTQEAVDDGLLLEI